MSRNISRRHAYITVRKFGKKVLEDFFFFRGRRLALRFDFPICTERGKDMWQQLKQHGPWNTINTPKLCHSILLSSTLFYVLLKALSVNNGHFAILYCVSVNSRPDASSLSVFGSFSQLSLSVSLFMASLASMLLLIFRLRLAIRLLTTNLVASIFE